MAARRHTRGTLATICLILTSMNNKKARKYLKWFLWEFLGTRAIWYKIKPPEKKPSTFFLWFLGIYFGLYGIAQQRYENRLDSLETRTNAVLAQLSIHDPKKILSLIPRIQKTKIPKEPIITNIFSSFSSLFGDGEYSRQVSNVLKEIIELNKESLKGAEISGIDLSGMNLSDLDLSETDLSMADLSNCNLSSVNFSRADLRGANLKNSYLSRTNFNNANMSYAKRDKNDLYGRDISRINQSCNRYTGVLETRFEHSYRDIESICWIPTNLNNTKLYNATFKNTDLSGVKFNNAEGLKVVQFLGAKSIYHAELGTKIIKHIRLKKTEILQQPFSLYAEHKLDSLFYHYPNNDDPISLMDKIARDYEKKFNN
ncbi:MAG: pentapeptide repeat-containing protein [Marinifilaceae bacterium]